MLNSLRRRDFFQVSTIASLALLSQSFVFSSSAIADTQGKEQQLETYHVYIPYKLARYGGEKTITLRSGDSYNVKIPSRLQDNYTVTIAGKGIKNLPISVVFHTLYEVSYNINGKIKEEIDKCNLLLTESTRKKCKLVYEQIEDGEEVKSEDLSLLDYIISTSYLDQNIIERYNIASANYKIYLIENKFNLALNNLNLPKDVKKNLVATAEYVKALDPVPNFDFLDLLDIIISEIDDLPLDLKSLYNQASLTSRAYTADLIILDFIKNNLPYRDGIYSKVYQKIRNGENLSEKDGEFFALDYLSKYIFDSKMPLNPKTMYFVAVDKLLGENALVSKLEIQQIFEEYLDIKENAEKSWENGTLLATRGLPLAHTALSALGVEAGTGITLDSLVGAAATNATLAWLGGGSVASGGLGILGGLSVVTGGAALIGAAGIMAMVTFSDLDAEDLVNLTVATLTGALAGTGTVGLAWLTASSMLVPSGLSGAAAISSTIAALGGLSVMTGGASLVAFAAGYVVWSFLSSNRKRDNKLLHYIETSSYALTDRTNDSIALYIEQNIHPKEYNSKQKIYLAPDIALDKLNDAIDTFAKNIPLDINEKIVVLIDTSTWNNANSGIILTNKKVIYKDGWDGTKIEKYDSLTSVSVEDISYWLLEEHKEQFSSFLLNLKKEKLALS
ncbi:hypothetical protein ACN4EE_21325 [Geminocystis sp. CENA526]|uniref:hypothetical protein n=1 Tax=Geminocystis sp. CENA526 TaxID=1355871 RepID=UPI003D6DC7A1